MAIPLFGDDSSLRFIDLFAGIGGFHVALHDLGARCVFASEINEFARLTYQHNFQQLDPTLFSSGRFAGDITKVDPRDIPDFDILTAGFPCQPFSNAGYKHGFDDPRGTLFFDIARIIDAKRPRAFFLENVRGLLTHDRGTTFKTMRRILEDFGYSVSWRIINAADFGLPQRRERLFIVGFRNSTLRFHFPKPVPLQLTMSQVLGGNCRRKVGFTVRVGGRGSGLRDRRNWDTYLVDGKEVRLTVDHARQMQGFPPSFAFPVSDRQAMKQLGNSVAVDAVRAVAKEILQVLAAEDRQLLTSQFAGSSAA